MQQCIARAFAMATRIRGLFNNIVNGCKTFVSIVIVQLVMNNTTWLLSIWAFESETSGLNGLCVFTVVPLPLWLWHVSPTLDQAGLTESSVPSPFLSLAQVSTSMLKNQVNGSSLLTVICFQNHIYKYFCVYVYIGIHQSLAKKDAEGWETVQRGRSMRPRSNTMVAKVSPVLAHVSPKDDSDKENQRIQPSSQEKSQEVREQEQPVPQEQSQETEKTSVIEVLTSTCFPY